MRGLFFSATRFSLVALLAMPIACRDQGPPAATEVAAKTRAVIVLPAKNGATLAVTSPAFKDGGDIPLENTQYKGNVFPGLSWTAGPAGTQSYAIIMQDGDGVRRNSNGQPILHWTMANIPPALTTLATEMTAPPDGAAFGPNGSGTNRPYLGPRTPPGPRHRYHFQVFALDTLLPANALATFEAMTAAMNGRVLASGELVE
jgi:Raf kinase inhibitor-like YbhB/YbcL family protein